MKKTSGTEIYHGSTRRRLLVGGIAASVTAPAILSRQVRAASQVIVRTPGGAYEDAIKAAIYGPFTRDTGIEVVTVAANIGKLLAMFRSGNIELDVIDTDVGPLTNLNRQGALAPIDYGKFKLSNPNSIDADVRLPFFVGNGYVGMIMGYNTEAFPPGSQPKSWAEFWDTNRFPGGRTLPDMAAGQPPLEFALIADGVAPDKLYPLNLDRAFASLDRLRPSIRKFWDTGAVSTQVITRKEAVLGAFWNARLQSAIDTGAPAAIEWNQGCFWAQGYSIFKGAHNPEGAIRLIDYALQPKVQAAFLSTYPFGPTVPEALALMPKSVVEKLPSYPPNKAKAFLLNVDWWEDNRQTVSDRWSKWLLSRG